MVKKRCIRCRQHVRDDGTCQNPNCVLYVPEKTEEQPKQEETPVEEPKKETTAEEEPKQDSATDGGK